MGHLYNWLMLELQVDYPDLVILGAYMHRVFYIYDLQDELILLFHVSIAFLW